MTVTLSTADRGWKYARAWLYAAMAGTNVLLVACLWWLSRSRRKGSD